MHSWQKLLNGDPLRWLLDPENPSVRTWTFVEILDRPANNPEVQEARAAITHPSLVTQLFTLQRPEGWRGDDETKPLNHDPVPNWVHRQVYLHP
jgi:hypothetical protein